MPYYPDIEFCIKLADLIGYHPFKGFTKMQVFRYSISWMLLPFAPILTITKLCNENEITVKKFIGVSINITMYLHALFRNSVLFFSRRQMKSLIEITKHFWAMEDYDIIVRKTRKGRITYTWIIFSFILSGCVKRHLNVRETGLYFPQWAPKHIWVLVQDIAAEWGLLGFISSDILFRTLLIQLTVQLKMLNRRLSNLYDFEEHDDRMVQNKFREYVEHYVILIRSQDSRLVIEGALHIITVLYMISFCYCLPAQDMTTEISNLSMSAYFSNWQNYTKNTKDIILVIQAAQKRFEISAGGIIPLNVQTLLAGLIRISVLFFGRRQMKYLIEATKHFWAMENYETIVERTRKGRITYTWITVSFVLAGCLKRHLNLQETGLYFPQWAPKHVWVLVQDLAQEWGLLSFISYDILFRTLLIQITIQLKMLNGRLLTLYDLKEHDGKLIQSKFRECVEHYVILIRCAEGINKLFSKVFIVTFACDIFSCTVSLYMIMGKADLKLCAEGSLHIMAVLYMFSFCYCMPAQDMTNQISNLSISAYLSNWQSFTANTKDIMLVIIVTQKPVEISAGGIIPLNMQTLLAACKAMVSYCMFLRTVDGSAN
nr:unnamed protein product [Callosobruchus chinensis]